jgi:branched-chain amino acid transport system ATP-binding protein
MTVEENLWMGGYCLPNQADAKDAATKVLDRYPRLKARAHEKAGVLSGGERRLLEIARALIMTPETLLIDEPSIGLEPRAIDMIFETLKELRETQGTTLILVEQNARKGLEFADIGYVLAAGRVVKAAKGRELLDDPDIGRLFLGG